MDSVKFVPPGGHRACLSCSAAKAKCVFPDDADLGDTSGLGSTLDIGGGFFMENTDTMSSMASTPGTSPGASSSSSQTAGVLAVPKCERCERLGRECLLPSRPRKKRRVGTIKPGTTKAAAAAAAAAASSGISSFSIISGSGLSAPATPAAFATMATPAVPATPAPSAISGVSPTPSPAQFSTPVPAPPPIPISASMSVTSATVSSAGSNSTAIQDTAMTGDTASLTTPAFSLSFDPHQPATPSGPAPWQLPAPPTPTTAGSHSGVIGIAKDNQQLPPNPFLFSQRLPQMSHPPQNPSLLRPHSPRLHHYQHQPYLAPTSAPGSAVPSTSAPLPSLAPGLVLVNPGLRMDSSTFNPVLNPSVSSPSALSSSAPMPPPASAAPPQPPPPPQINAPPQPSTAPGNPLRTLLSATLSMKGKEADEIMRFYRDAFTRFNPYMEAPSMSVTAADIQTQKPLMWLSICFATSYDDFERQTRLARTILFYIGEQIFRYGHKSLELLQGVILLLNWFGTQNYVLPQYTNLIHMAMAMVSDLGLNKLEFSKTADKSPLDAYVSMTIHGATLQAPKEGHTLDERRALAACYCLSHAICGTLSMSSPLQYTLQLEDTCRYFEERYKASLSDPSNGSDPAAAATLSADLRLAVAVHLYHIISKIIQAQQEADLCGRFVVPPRTLIRHNLAELGHLWGTLPPEAQADFTIKLLYHTAEIHVYKLGLPSLSANPRSNISAPGPMDEDTDDDAAPDESIALRCLKSLNSFFEVFFTIPITIYNQLPITILAQLVHADVTLAKLTAMWRGNPRPPGAPPDMRLPSFTGVMEALATRFQEASTIPHPLGRVTRKNIYESYAARMRSYKLLKFPGRPKATGPGAGAGAGAGANATASATPNPAATNAAEANAGAHPGAIAQTKNSPRLHQGYLATQRPPSSARSTASSSLLSIESLVAPGADGGSAARLNSWANAIPSDHSRSSSVTRASGLGDDHGNSLLDSSNSLRDLSLNYVGSDADLNVDDTEAQWSTWFQNFETSIYGRPAGSTAAGSTSGMSVGAGEDGQPRSRRPRGSAGSIGSIDSLLNNNDLEPDYHSYIQQQQQQQQLQAQHLLVLQHQEEQEQLVRKHQQEEQRYAMEVHQLQEQLQQMQLQLQQQQQQLERQHHQLKEQQQNIQLQQQQRQQQQHHQQHGDPMGGLFEGSQSSLSIRSGYQLDNYGP